MQNGRDALVASACGTWNNVEHRGHSIQRRAQRAFDGARSRQARPSRATIPEETTGGTRLSRPTTERGTTWNTGGIPFNATRRGRSMGHGRDKRDPPPRPSRRRQTGGTRLSRPPTERGTQGTSNSAPRAEGVRWGTVATSATLPRADAVRWGTVATSATFPRDHPGGDKREGRACRVHLRNVEHRGHSIQRHAQRAFDGARSRQARPSRATIPEDKREGRACRVRLRNVASARATRLGNLTRPA